MALALFPEVQLCPLVFNLSLLICKRGSQQSLCPGAVWRLWCPGWRWLWSPQLSGRVLLRLRVGLCREACGTWGDAEGGGARHTSVGRPYRFR